MASSTPHPSWHWDKSPTYVHDSLIQGNQLMMQYWNPQWKLELKSCLGRKPLSDKNLAPLHIEVSAILFPVNKG